MVVDLREDIQIELKKLDKLRYVQFIRSIVNKDRIKKFNDYFTNLFKTISINRFPVNSNSDMEIKCMIPPTIQAKIFFSAMSLYKYPEHILEINKNEHDKIIYNIAKCTYESIFKDAQKFLIQFNHFYNEFNIWKKKDLEYQMNQCKDSINTLENINNMTNKNSETNKFYNNPLTNVKTQIENHITFLNKVKTE